MATALLIAFLLLITLLAIPLTCRFHISWNQALISQVRLEWAFGLVRVTLPPAKDWASQVGDEKLSLDTAHTDKSASAKLNLFKAFRHRPFRQRILRFIGDCWRAFKKRELKLYLRIGLGDPAETGQLWALVGPVGGMLANAREAEITIEPEFIGQTFELDTNGQIQVIPLQLIYLILALLLSPVLWGGIRQARS